MKKVISIATCFLLFCNYACAQEIKIYRDGEILHFEGQINHSSAQVLVEHLRNGVKHLHISSIGGDAEAALYIGKEMRQVRASLTVTRFCYSSCANYLFLSAEKKVLETNAILGFHGGFFKEIEPEMLKLLPEKLSQLLQRDQEHFQALKIDRGIFKISYDLTRPDRKSVIYSLSTPRGVQEFQSEKEAVLALEELKSRGQDAELKFEDRGISESKVYFPSENTLRKFGVTGIQAYYYPQNKKEVARLEKINEVEIVGDWER